VFIGVHSWLKISSLGSPSFFVFYAFSRGQLPVTMCSARRRTQRPVRSRSPIVHRECRRFFTTDCTDDTDIRGARNPWLNGDHVFGETPNTATGSVALPATKIFGTVNFRKRTHRTQSVG